MAKEYTPYKYCTLRDVIETGKTVETSEKTMAFRENIDDLFIIPYHNIITKYYDTIKNYITTYEMTDTEYQKWKYQPRKMCYDMYGTPELASSLLYINNMVSVTEFTKKKLKIFQLDFLDVVNELFEILEYDLKNNRMRIAELEKA